MNKQCTGYLDTELFHSAVLARKTFSESTYLTIPQRYRDQIPASFTPASLFFSSQYELELTLEKSFKSYNFQKEQSRRKTNIKVVEIMDTCETQTLFLLSLRKKNNFNQKKKNQ